MLSLLRSAGGSSALDKALATDENLVIPVNIGALPIFKRAFRIKKSDLDAGLATTRAAQGISSSPAGWEIRVMNSGVERRVFPITYRGSGNVPNIVPVVSTTIVSSSTIKTADRDMRIGFAASRFVDAAATMGTAVVDNGNLPTVQLMRNDIRISSSDQPWNATGLNQGVNIVEGSGMSVYNNVTTASFVHRASGRETPEVPLFRVGNPFSPGQYRPLPQGNVRSSTGSTGNIPAGTVINAVYAMVRNDVYHINNDDITTFTVDVSGVLRLSWNGSSGMYLQNTNNENRVNASRVLLYKLSSHTRWNVFTGTTIDIANLFPEGSITTTTAAAVINQARGIVAVVSLSLVDDYLDRWRDFDLKIRNGGTGTIYNLSTGQRTTTSYEFRTISTSSTSVSVLVEWRLSPTGSVNPSAGGSQFTEPGRPVRISLSIPNYPSVVLNRFYAQLLTATNVPGSNNTQKQTWANENLGGLNGGNFNSSTGPWGRIYSGENVSFNWTGGGVVVDTPRTTNNTPSLPPSAIGTIDWSGSGTVFTVNEGDYFQIVSNNPLAISLPIEFV